MSGQTRNCTYNNGDRVVPDALVVVDDAHPLQRHEPAVWVAVHHLRAHVLHRRRIPRVRSEIHKLQRENRRHVKKKSYLDLGPGSGGAGAGRVHHRQLPLSHLENKRKNEGGREISNSGTWLEAEEDGKVGSGSRGYPLDGGGVVGTLLERVQVAQLLLLAALA
jgi:hypothetical protein